MALTGSGTISASDIRAEFVGGSSAVDISSYFRGANTNVKLTQQIIQQLT